jgi:hypothetical protein
VRILQKKNVPVDGVGWQLHNTVDFGRYRYRRAGAMGGAEHARMIHALTDEQYIDSHRENCRRFADLGLELWATEVDVVLDPRKDPEPQYERQAFVMRKLVETALEFDAYKGFKMWGVMDVGTPADRADEEKRFIPWYMFFPDGRPKPVFFAVRDAFENYHPKPVAVCAFGGDAVDQGQGWTGPWALSGAEMAADSGFKGEGCLKLAKADDAAVRGVDLSGKYNSHLFYRWKADDPEASKPYAPWKNAYGVAEPDDAPGAPRVVVEISGTGREWRQVKVHDAKELRWRRIEGDWHAGYATISALDGKPDVKVRFRAIGDIRPFRIDELQVIADDEATPRGTQ